jgi:hypothetical protein
MGPAQPVIVQNSGFWQRLFDGIVRFIWLLNGHYVLSATQRNLWRERTDIRRKILGNIAFFWGYAWTAGCLLLMAAWNFNFLLPFVSVFLAMGLFLLLYLMFGRSRTALTLAGYILIVVIFWLLMINAPVFVLKDLNRFSLLSLNILNPQLSYLLWGWVWIALVYIVVLFMPIWMVEIQYGDVYLVRDESNERFHLDSRAGPRVDREVIETLVAGGIPREVIATFIRFNGPFYMRKTLLEKIDSDTDLTTRRMLQTLFDQVADKSRTPPPILWVSALDDERLLWDRKRSVNVRNLVIDQLMTKDGHPVKIELAFDCSFDPEAIRNPEFRLSLAKIHSTSEMAQRIEDVMKAGAISAARLYFIRLPLRAALTQGTVEDFRRDFPSLMAGFQALGIVVNPASVLCHPVIDPLVQQAETDMLASRARALSETAKLQALIEKVMLHGVPPDLLAGLLFLDQGTSGPNKGLQMQSASDIMPLPEPDNQQQARYIYQKFRGDVPGDIIPELPLPPASEEPKKQLPPPDDSVDWSRRGDRFTSNIGNRPKKKDS